MFSDNRAKHLGQIYRLIEQFELISRSDLAKLSGLAPASVTNLTKTLIEQHFILERTVQYNQSRGRPAVGLAVSHFFWRLLSLTISPQKIEISLCKLNGEQIYQKNHILSQKDYPNLSNHLVSLIERFSKVYRLEYCNILAVSVSVVGKIDINRENITQLGNVNLHCAIKSKLSPLFNCPVLVSEHFQLWLLAESTLGSLIRHNNVIFLQLDDTINLSVLLNGSLLHSILE